MYSSFPIVSDWIHNVQASWPSAEKCPAQAKKRLERATRQSCPEVMKAVVRANQNNAGIYGAVTRIGRLAVGQAIILHAAGRTICANR